jgi:uncharacterized protein
VLWPPSKHYQRLEEIMRPDIMTSSRQKIAVIGSGIAGHTAAWALAKVHDVTLYEADDRFGGHANTVDIDLNGIATPVDTGFIVYNELNYPNLIALFDHLGVETKKSNMSFGLSLHGGKFEYRSDKAISSLFARKRNAVSLRFWLMLRDLVKFYGLGADLIHRPDINTITLRELLTELNLSQGFIDDHLVPMAACIWSASYNQILNFPAATFVRFFTNHGLFIIKDRPQWRTVTGGSRSYIAALHNDMKVRALKNARVRSVVREMAGVRVIADGQPAMVYDHVVMAAHGDQTLAMIDAPTCQEREILTKFQYSKNIAVLHRDKNLMPKRKAVWSSWNYVAPPGHSRDADVPITYWMNLLQGIDPAHDVFVSLNPRTKIADPLIEQTFKYEHPIFDGAAIAAQSRLGEIQGADRLWFCGSYWGHGFHEDACASGVAVARALGGAPPWEQFVPKYLAAAE